MSFIPVNLSFSSGSKGSHDLLEDLFAEQTVTVNLMAMPSVGDTIAIDSSLFFPGFVACAEEKYQILKEDDGVMWFKVHSLAHRIDAEGKHSIKVYITFS